MYYGEKKMTDNLVNELRKGTMFDSDNVLMHDAADRIETLEAALRDVYEVYAGSEGIPQRMTAAEGYLLHLVKEMANTARAALGETKE